MEKLEGKERGRNWLCEWSPRRKRLNPSPSHTLKPEEALLEIPGISYCRCPGPGTRELGGGRRAREGLASLSQAFWRTWEQLGGEETQWAELS